ncbi:MAG: nucleotidyltransferase family protein [Beijerinckiaceae bacterium]
MLDKAISKQAIDHAMVLAAGLGTRMRPITNTMPKPLIPVAGKALIDYILDYCRAAGVQQTVVNVHYFAEQMEAHLADVKSPRIVISDERAALLDSGGGIKKALPHLGQNPFFIMNADAIWVDGPTPSLTRLSDYWDPEKMDILLLLAHTSTATGWGNRGDFSMDQAGRLTRAGKDKITPYVYAGAGIWKPELFAGRPDVFSLNRLFDEAIEKERLFGLRLDGVWMHVGTPDAIPEAEEAMARSAR